MVVGKFRLLDSHSLRSGHPEGFPGTVDAPRIALPGNLQGGASLPFEPLENLLRKLKEEGTI